MNINLDHLTPKHYLCTAFRQCDCQAALDITNKICSVLACTTVAENFYKTL